MPSELTRIVKPTLLGALFAVAVADLVHAVDGVIEINQARAKAGGVVPNDTPLFPSPSTCLAAIG
jgi:hypothetical protein